MGFRILGYAVILSLGLTACQKGLNSDGSTAGNSSEGGLGAPTSGPYSQLSVNPDNKRYFIDLKTGKPVLVTAIDDPDWFLLSQGPSVNNREFGSEVAANPDLINEEVEKRWSEDKAINASGVGRGLADPTILRRQAWTAMLSGSNIHIQGALPGAKAKELVQNIRDFISQSEWDFVWSYPNKLNAGSAGGFCMTHMSYEYVCYFNTQTQKDVNIPLGNYRVRWWNPRDGGFVGTTDVDHPGGRMYLTPPDAADWVLHVRSLEPKPVYPSGTKCFPIPPRLQTVKFVIHNHPRAYRYILDSTPLVRSGDGPQFKYCQKVMNDPYRNDCPVRPEGDPMRAACETAVVGIDPTDGIVAPHFTVNAGADFGRRPENPYLLQVNTVPGVVTTATACSNVYKDVCSSVTLPAE